MGSWPMDPQPTLRLHRSFAARSIGSIRSVAASERTGAADTLLGMALTFIAGAINASRFLAVGQYAAVMRSHHLCTGGPGGRKWFPVGCGRQIPLQTEGMGIRHPCHPCHPQYLRQAPICSRPRACDRWSRHLEWEIESL